MIHMKLAKFSWKMLSDMLKCNSKQIINICMSTSAEYISQGSDGSKKPTTKKTEFSEKEKIQNK